MPLHDPVYLLSTSPTCRSYRLKDDTHALLLARRRWGEPETRDWLTPELVPSEQSLSKPDADFTGLHLPGLIVATERAAAVVDFPELEREPVSVGTEKRWILNPHIVVRRTREGADVTRLPTGEVVLIRRADFYANDVPKDPCCFWFRGGGAARILLCNEGFRARVEEAELAGLAFTLIGHAF